MLYNYNVIINVNKHPRELAFIGGHILLSIAPNSDGKIRLRCKMVSPAISPVVGRTGE